MLRRSILQLTSPGSVCRVPLRTTTQIPSYLSSRRAFSVSQKNEPHKPETGSNAVPEQPSLFPKLLTGGLALGSIFLAAYYYGVLETYLGKHRENIRDTKAQINDKRTSTLPGHKDVQQEAKELSETTPDSRELDVSVSAANHLKRDQINSDLRVPVDSPITDTSENHQSKDEKALTQDNVEEKDMAVNPQTTLPSYDANRTKPNEEGFDVNKGLKPDPEQSKSIEVVPYPSADKTPIEIGIIPEQRDQPTIHDMQEEAGTQKSVSLLDDYLLSDNLDKSTTADSQELKKLKDLSSMVEHSYDGVINKDGKLVLDFLQAIHAAEERQAALDARSFNEEKRAIKEKYEKDLKDARVRELMYAEREAILEKELNKERVKSAAALKSLQEKLEEKLKTELEQKEIEVGKQLKKIQEMAKAELAAAVASEKASQIEKMAEANLHINALCMAFFARSEEARQNHSVHKLALGALSLEDALSKGLPIQKEIEALHTHIEGIDNDSLIALVLSSLPEETQQHGTDTFSQLNHKFDALKGVLRHFSLIPPSGGGILTHSLAQVASWLKVKEVDETGDGIDSLINRVENLLAQGKLCEAADTLENGVKGSKAAEVVQDWVTQARNRAITEQALTVLQSYATSISLT